MVGEGGGPRGAQGEGGQHGGGGVGLVCKKEVDSHLAQFSLHLKWAQNLIKQLHKSQRSLHAPHVLVQKTLEANHHIDDFCRSVDQLLNASGEDGEEDEVFGGELKLDVCELVLEDGKLFTLLNTEDLKPVSDEDVESEDSGASGSCFGRIRTKLKLK